AGAMIVLPLSSAAGPQMSVSTSFRLVGDRFRVSNQSADCSKELGRGLGFAQKGVCSRAPGGLFVIIRRQHDDRSATPVSDLSRARDQFQAAYSRKVVIKNKDIIMIVAGEFQQRRITVGAKIDLPVLCRHNVAN